MTSDRGWPRVPGLAFPRCSLAGRGRRCRGDCRAIFRGCEAAEQWLVEEELIRTVDLPLTLDQNRHHAFHAELSRLQAEQKEKARELPTLPR